MTALLALFISAGSKAADNDGPTFVHDFKTARATSEKTGKPLIVIFSASWCPPCQQMKNNVYPSKEVRPHHNDFVWAYLDADAEENRPLAAQFGVSGIPHIAFLHPDGNPIGYFNGAVPAETFSGILSKVLNAENNPSQGSGSKAGSGSKS